LHAEALKLTFTGTMGILLRAKVEGRIPRIEHPAAAQAVTKAAAQ
jgi:predicted nucleic acid-binding protein